MTRPAGREWTVEEAALFAARRDFELLRLLSTDRRALATARRLGYATVAAAKVVGKPQQADAAGFAGGEAVLMVRSVTEARGAAVSRASRARRASRS